MPPSALAMLPVLAAASAGAPPLCPAAAPVAGAEGLVEVAPLPAPRAQALNNEGKALYRQGSWAAARARYQAALDADPAFLAPALNLACAFAREERHADAAREAAALIRRAFVPWGREVMEAADLAVLHVRPEMSQLRAARAEAALRWGQSLEGTLLFVARLRPPVRARGEGVLTLGLQQEIFAWSPRTGRLHQVTADDGRVLAFARALDGRSLVYVRGGKLVREAGEPAAGPPRLRGLALVRLDLVSMAATPAVDLPGDVAALELWPPAGGAVELRVTAAPDTPARVFRASGTVLEPAPALSPAAAARAPAVRLDGRGVTGRAATPAGAGACRFRAADDFATGKPARVLVHPAGGRARRPFPLAARYGAGLHGMPFDDDSTTPK